MKRCSRCKREKPLAEFHRNAAKPDGRQTACKECHRAYVRSHYEKRPAYYKAKSVRQTRVKRAAIRKVIEAAKDRPCMDCGVAHPTYVMDFDHVRGTKRFNIGRGLSSWTVADVEAEIAKCEVVCANCHREREHQKCQVA